MRINLQPHFRDELDKERARVPEKNRKVKYFLTNPGINLQPHFQLPFRTESQQLSHTVRLYDFCTPNLPGSQQFSHTNCVLQFGL